MILNIELTILIMAIITFSCRYLFFMKTLPIQLGEKRKRLLKFTAPSVLTAMWVPIVFFGHRNIEVEVIQSPYLYAGLITIILSLKLKNTLGVVTLGMALFIAIRLIN